MSMTKTVIAVVISTSLGDINLELDKENAPVTVENFINLAESGYLMRLSFIELLMALWSKVEA